MTTRTRPLINAGMFTSRTDLWSTPKAFWDRLDREFHFDLDPASTHENALCERHFTEVENGLAQPWCGGGAVWLNPPFGRTLGLWVAKALYESQRGATVVALLPARTDTRWWFGHVTQAHEIRFVRGRLKFTCPGQQGSQSAPFPTAVVIFRRGISLGGPRVRFVEQ